MLLPDPNRISNSVLTQQISLVLAKHSKLTSEAVAFLVIV